MSNRDFSDSAKLEVITENLAKNNGQIQCEICGKKLSSIADCHFDHIEPYAKGGKSTADNCQILCISCNLSKTDKEMKDFLLEEKARRFFAGESIDANVSEIAENEHKLDSDGMSKEQFDKQIANFIKKKGDIHKVDFGRTYNNLPSIHYVRKYYGDLNSLKKAFGIEDLSYSWNRDTIKMALVNYVLQHGTIGQKDMKKENKLPSVPCVLAHYPEYKNFTDIKRGLCNLDVPEEWTVENVTASAREYVKKHGRVTQKDLRAANNLPAAKVIERLFGSFSAFQEAVGSEISIKHEFATKEDISRAVDTYFNGKERIVESSKVFFDSFQYSPSTIHKRYGSFAVFFMEQGIQVINSKKAKYSKREVDDAISNWVKAGNGIPAAKDLYQLGLPSREVIRKFYEDWKEPFVLYEKLYEEVSRN